MKKELMGYLLIILMMSGCYSDPVFLQDQKANWDDATLQLVEEQRLEAGLKMEHIIVELGKPKRKITYTDRKKPTQEWIYSNTHKGDLHLIFVDGYLAQWHREKNNN